MLAVLVDPDKASVQHLLSLINHASFNEVDLIFVGGSLVTEGDMDNCLSMLKEYTAKPIIIFPGSPNQINAKADAIFLLSLISGRNPDLLIGRHVESAFALKQSELEIIPTGYVLIDGGKATTVSYISGTTPIPQDKPEIAAATAIAGQQTGNTVIYLDCGSGALYPAHPNLIKKVKSQLDVPLIVGGGIINQKQALEAFTAGADVVVVGNKLEEDPNFLDELVQAKKQATLVPTQIL